MRTMSLALSKLRKKQSIGRRRMVTVPLSLASGTSMTRRFLTIGGRLKAGAGCPILSRCLRKGGIRFVMSHALRSPVRSGQDGASAAPPGLTVYLAAYPPFSARMRSPSGWARLFRACGAGTSGESDTHLAYARQKVVISVMGINIRRRGRLRSTIFQFSMFQFSMFGNSGDFGNRNQVGWPTLSPDVGEGWDSIKYKRRGRARAEPRCFRRRLQL